MFGTMFERRARVVLLTAVLASAGLLVRAAQIQIGQNARWNDAADETLRRSVLTETTRGRILDSRGRVLAEDVPCNDAAVAFWFVKEPPDDKRLWQLQRDIARRTPGYFEADSDEQMARVRGSRDAALATLDAMWQTLAEVGGVTRAEVEETRRQIVSRVEMRRKSIIHARYRRAVREQEDLNPRWWKRFLLGEAFAPPEIDQFDEPIAEELQAHVVLRDITNDQYNQLRKMQVDLPGLTLRASRTRHYPFGGAAAHVTGRLARVEREDLQDDAEFDDELRRYYPNDQIGREGLEQVAEVTLRGRRGRIDHDRERGSATVAHEPVGGSDVRSTIDVLFQRDVRSAFERVTWAWPREVATDPRPDPEVGPAPGAAVVIDVKTGAVRALVSYPDFDPNTYDEDYRRLVADDVGRPLMNRALRFTAVPGSTVKPVVGIAAITDRIIDADGTVECDGYMVADGRRFARVGRCWTASMFPNFPQGHQTGSDKHPTPGLNPRGDPEPGLLTFADAVQRSCNIYFETLGHHMGHQRLTWWFDRFGLGRPTGSGLPERAGLLPRDLPADVLADRNQLRNNTWFAAIGQGYVQATPIQMANVAATFAREGVWVRPTLLDDQTPAALAEKADLKLDRRGLDMARRGMAAAVITAGGSGNTINRHVPVVVAGKTGTAQAHPLSAVVRSGDGTPLLDDEGRPVTRLLEHGVRGRLNPVAPWYRRVNPQRDDRPRQSHGWFIGYAPADDPQIAFAVFVEYGGSGGTSAGSVVVQIVDAAVRHGYLTPTRQPDPRARGGELLYTPEAW